MAKSLLNVIITTSEIGKDVENALKINGKNCLVVDNCRGVTESTGILDFLGFTATEKCMICFMSSGKTHKVLLDFLLENYNKNNNGIMFEICSDKEDSMEIKNKLLVVVTKTGHSERVTTIIKEVCGSGATIIDARGSGKDYEEFMGMNINSGKEIVLSVIKKENLTKVVKQIKEAFKEEQDNLYFFDADIKNFNKLHNKK